MVTAVAASAASPPPGPRNPRTARHTHWAGLWLSAADGQRLTRQNRIRPDGDCGRGRATMAIEKTNDDVKFH